tara:strand:+ start:11168 stop:12148 length:981 start_codon:yes stop_codon:yes gene_type:complete
MDTQVEVTIEAPKIDETNENLYRFKLTQPAGNPLVFQSTCTYSVNSEQGEQMLTIPCKDDLKYLSGVFSKLKATFLEKHEEWFEHKFTSTVLDDLFKNFLHPNITENCIDLKVTVHPSVLDRLRDSSGNENEFCRVVPKFVFYEIVLNVENNKMNCRVILDEYVLPAVEDLGLEPVIEEDEEDESPQENEKESHQEPELTQTNMKETHADADISLQQDTSVVDKRNMMESQPNIEEKSNELEELHVDTSNLDESEIKVNVEDYLIIYKYILGQIKENKIREIEKICSNKGIEMEMIEYEEIFNDSEEEYLSSDTNSENSDDETSFN